MCSHSFLSVQNISRTLASARFSSLNYLSQAGAFLVVNILLYFFSASDILTSVNQILLLLEGGTMTGWPWKRTGENLFYNFVLVVHTIFS